MLTTLCTAVCTASPAGRGGSSKTQGLGQQFKNSLGSLVDNINTTGVHYGAGLPLQRFAFSTGFAASIVRLLLTFRVQWAVRCIKPNLEKSSTKYDERRVSDQLRCQGILEAIRIARAAYPNRLPHSDLNDRYQLCLRDPELAKNASSADAVGKKCKGADPKVAAQFLLEALNLGDGQFQVGKTKIFFRRAALELLEAARARVVDGCLVRLQASVRKMVYSNRFGARWSTN